MALTIISAILGGLAVGILSGLLGVGGGIIMIPLLRLLFGVDALVATGASLFVILPTSIAGVLGRIRSKGLHVKLSIIISLGGILFSPIGSWLASFAGGPASMFAAAIVIAYTGANMVRKALAWKKQATDAPTATSHSPVRESAATRPAQKAISSSSPDQETVASSKPKAGRISNGFATTRRCILAAITVGVAAGFLSGFIGVGGGFIIVPMVIWLFGMNFKDATGVSLLALCILSIPGIVTHGLYGHIDYLRGAMLALGSIPGSLLGSMLLRKIPEKGLKIAFGFLLVAMAIILALNEVGA